MCIILSLLSPEYAASQQAGATSIPEETAPRQTRQGEVVESADSDIPEFQGRIRGPNLPVGWDVEKKKPIDYFQLFITKDVTKQWICSTNSAGKNLVCGRTWTDVTFNEMLAFLALVVFSGVVKYQGKDEKVPNLCSPLP